jgi:hypothetical protein
MYSNVTELIPSERIWRIVWAHSPPPSLRDMHLRGLWSRGGMWRFIVSHPTSDETYRMAGSLARSEERSERVLCVAPSTRDELLQLR